MVTGIGAMVETEAAATEMAAETAIIAEEATGTTATVAIEENATTATATGSSQGRRRTRKSPRRPSPRGARR